MNKDLFIEKLKMAKYNLYYNWENCEKLLNDEIDMLISYYQKELATENAELKAKVYTYEKLIANSNFKAINNKSVESLNKKIKELEEELETLRGD